MHYFADASKTNIRLHFNVHNGEPRGMSMFNLLYPSKYLADLYRPIQCMNEVDVKGDREKLKSIKQHWPREILYLTRTIGSITTNAFRRT